MGDQNTLLTSIKAIYKVTTATEDDDIAVTDLIRMFSGTAPGVSKTPDKKTHRKVGPSGSAVIPQLIRESPGLTVMEYVSRLRALGHKKFIELSDDEASKSVLQRARKDSRHFIVKDGRIWSQKAWQEYNYPRLVEKSGG